MPEPKIDKVKLHRLLSSGKSQREAAHIFGVTEGAISKAAKGLNIAVVKNVALENAHKVVNKGLNTIDQLQKINDYANELLDLLMRWNKGDTEALQILESQVSTKKVRIGDKEEFVKEFKFKDPRELALKAMAEIRGQLGLQLEIFKTLYDMEASGGVSAGSIDSDSGGEARCQKCNCPDDLKKERAIRGSISFRLISDFLGTSPVSIPSLGEWAEQTPVILDGKPFTFKRHEYLMEPYQDDHPFQVEMKAAQMGLTSRAMLKTIYKARYGSYRGILYLFPSKTDVTDF